MVSVIAKAFAFFLCTMLVFAVGVVTGLNEKQFAKQLGIGVLASLLVAAILYFL